MDKDLLEYDEKKKAVYVSKKIRKKATSALINDL